MKTISKIFFIAILATSSSAIYGQSVEDIYRISYKTRASGTARSAAMGGAFTSLGADAASISINPAGLGMYRSSEISLTPSIFISSVKSDALQGNSILGTKKRFGDAHLSNFAAIFNVYNSPKSLVSGVTIGVSYYNEGYTKYDALALSGKTGGSIGDLFSRQLYNTSAPSITSSSSDPMAVYRQKSSGYWGAMMAYNNGYLMGVEKDGITNYSIDPLSLASTDFVLPSQLKRERTMINTFSFAGGINMSDIVYLGVSLGVRDYRYYSESTYQEEAVNGNSGDFKSLSYLQNHTMLGRAFDAKIGATIQPIDGLRIGAAYHFPTLTILDDEYYADMSNSYTNGDYYTASTPYDVIDYDVKSAGRFLAGISYRFPIGIISFDYEKVYYNKMMVKNMKWGGGDFNTELGEKYKASDNFMAGLELMIARGFFFRGGYAYYGSALKNEDKKYGTTEDISLGLGFKTNIFYADLTYINSQRRSLPFKYFGGNFDDVTILSESTIDQKFVDSTISLTVGFRF